MKLSSSADSLGPQLLSQPQHEYQYRLSDLDCSVRFALSVLGDLCCYCRRITGETVVISDTASLSGKCEYVVVYFIEFQISSEDRDVIATCSDFLPVRDDFELLLVPKLQDLDLPEYSDFLSKLPSSCIVAPLHGQAHYDDIRTYFSDSAASKFFLVNVKANTFCSGPRCIDLLFNLVRDCIVTSSWPIIIPEEQNKPRISDFACPVTQKLKAVFPDYSDDIQDMMVPSLSCSIEIGKYFDVLSLLSCGGQLKYLHRLTGDTVKLEEKTFQGKYIMVCCVHAPITRADFRAQLLQAVSTTCSDLFMRKDIDFEMVVVAKMNKLANHEGVFNHFLKGFPSACLAVPFKDSQCRDFICNYLGIHYPFEIECLLLDTDRNVLLYNFPSRILDFGADGFPFTKQVVEEILYHDFTMWNYPSESKLAALMGCSPSDVLYKINPADDRQEITVSELSNKVVGLYLCLEKEIDPVHLKVLKECRDIEIVLVYYPLGDCLDPHVFQQQINSLLKELNVGWWCLPYNDSVSRRLKRLTLCEPYNGIVIVGPHAKYVDPYGGDVMKYYGADLFPFTREELVQRVLSKISDLTLESLLSHYNYVLRGKEKIAVADLPRMNVLVYFGTLFNDDLYDEVSTEYHKLKAEIADFEIIFVRRNGRYVEGAEELISKMPWLVCPFDASVSDFLQERIFHEDKGRVGDALVEFGKDGHVCSLSSGCISDDPAVRGNAFKDNLREDVISQLCDRSFHFEFMDGFQ